MVRLCRLQHVRIRRLLKLLFQCLVLYVSTRLSTYDRYDFRSKCDKIDLRLLQRHLALAGDLDQAWWGLHVWS